MLWRSVLSIIELPKTFELPAGTATPMGKSVNWYKLATSPELDELEEELLELEEELLELDDELLLELAPPLPPPLPPQAVSVARINRMLIPKV